MQPRRKTRSILASILVLILFSSLPVSIETSGQIFELSDLYVYVRVNMNEEAIAFYNVNMTMGPRTMRALREANWTFKIQLPKWAASNLVSSVDMPKLFLEKGNMVALKLEEKTDYDYLVAEIPPIQSDRLNATVKFGLVQRDEISEDRVGFRLPVLTGFSIMPEYVNFTFITTGTIIEYSLLYFNPIFSNATVIGLWNQYFRTKTVGNATGKIRFPSRYFFDRCVIESLVREITVTEQLQVSVRDRLKLKCAGISYRSEILELSIPSNIDQILKVKDVLGPLRTHSVATGLNTSILTVYSRYPLRPGQEYEVSVEYSIPVKNILVNASGSLITVWLKNLVNYSDIVNRYSLSVKVEGRRGWRITVEFAATNVKAGEVFSRNVTNAMPDVLVQPLEISFTSVQLESGRSLSIILGLLTVFVLLVVDLFREKTVKELRREKEVEPLIDDFIRALREKIDYEARLEDTKVKNALGKLSSKNYRVGVEEYSRRISGTEKKISRILEQLSIKNPKAGEEVKRRYAVFEEINSDSKKMVDSAIERFRGGRTTRSVFENLTEKYLKENRKRRETAANDVYSALERLLS